MKRILILVMVGSVSAMPSVSAQGVDATAAQGKMQGRISKEINQFLQHTGASSELYQYCSLEMALVLTQYPNNGFIPFGVNYNSITTQQHLDMVINSRETYETTRIKLCIARAKRDLDEALK